MKWIPLWTGQGLKPKTLGEHQELMSECYSLLLKHAFLLGFQIRLGETKRDPRIAALNAASRVGISKSLHIDGLAADINLFKDGKFLSLTTDHIPLGAYWKALHPLATWGGDFKKPDGNHYSITWKGRR